MSNRSKSVAASLRAQDRKRLEKSHDKVTDPDAIFHSLLYGADPVAFARDCLGFHADPWQADMLRSQSRKQALCWARQSGKSDSVAIRALHRALFYRRSMILIVSPSERQSMEVLHKIGVHLSKLRLPVKPVEDNKLSLELANGSRILSLPATEKTIRGFSAVDLLIEDEAGDVPDSLYEAMEPMLQVSKGTQILMGTPKGPKGHFAEIFRSGLGWERSTATAWDNPRVDNEELTAIRAEKTRLGRLFWFQQEYECAFLASGSGLVYPYDLQLNVLDKRLLMHRNFGWQYALGVDYGMTAACGFVVLGWRSDDPTLYVLESFKKRDLLPADAADIVKGLCAKYPFARIVGDAGGLGKPYVEEVRRRLRIPMEYAQKNNKRGYIELFVGDLKVGNIKVVPGNEDLLAEWQLLPWDEDRELPAEGYEDHLSDACLYAWRSCYHFVEKVRKEGPKRGSEEALQQEADLIYERHLADEQERMGGKDEWQIATDTTSFFN